MAPRPELRVVATAGHVDHGKSTLIARLTGIDPDRWEEEKRRGLTIDLGYAWCTLPDGREIGFVDVPGHERFIANMLAGVGPVRLVLFVVAADEGWKPQSEEHLQILDVLGVSGAVIVLTKTDLVDGEQLERARTDVHDRVAGTALAGAVIVPVSASTGGGIETLVEALATMVSCAAPPLPARARLFIDRIFAIKGAGTVVTGTLEGADLEVGQDVQILPSGEHARIRSLQTHKQSEDRATPVSRVAANLVGADRETLMRGDVLTLAGQWRPGAVIEAELRPVRGLTHPITPRGAYKLYAGAAEVDARLRVYGTTDDGPSSGTYVRMRLSRALPLSPGDRFVLRESGRRETVGGGVVLDTAPPTRAGTDAVARLAARADAIESGDRDLLVSLLIAERGSLPAAALMEQLGVSPPSQTWLFSENLRRAFEDAVVRTLEEHHRANPLQPGADLDAIRGLLTRTARRSGARTEPGLADAAIAELVSGGTVVREGGVLRLPSHDPAPAGTPDTGRLLAALDSPTPPTAKQLQTSGFQRDVIDAAVRTGLAVRVSPELILSAEMVANAVALVNAAPQGITVSAVREGLGTSRRYAVPLVEWLDKQGITRREGDLRFPRDPSG
ncbi:MAG: selenocysteine-specific elongation factor [Actinomycetota bacterium]|jgi:selenocysteine-specific elongation factor|nr:selenocysteine-specific elongation factor [Actinomycetota bacterium]